MIASIFPKTNQEQINNKCGENVDNPKHKEQMNFILSKG
jgi:hypothetical protein